MVVSGQRCAPAALPPGKHPGTHRIGRGVGPRAVLDIAVVKRKIPSPRWESNPRTPIVQPVALWVVQKNMTHCTLLKYSIMQVAHCKLIMSRTTVRGGNHINTSPTHKNLDFVSYLSDLLCFHRILYPFILSCNFIAFTSIVLSFFSTCVAVS
jgi:hypothetical protein